MIVQVEQIGGVWRDADFVDLAAIGFEGSSDFGRASKADGQPPRDFPFFRDNLNCFVWT